MIEEELRGQLIQVLSAYSQGGMSLGSIYYILKDVFKDVEQSYATYIQNLQEQKMAEKENPSEENEEDLENEELGYKGENFITNLEEGETITRE